MAHRAEVLRAVVPSSQPVRVTLTSKLWTCVTCELSHTTLSHTTSAGIRSSGARLELRKSAPTAPSVVTYALKLGRVLSTNPARAFTFHQTRAHMPAPHRRAWGRPGARAELTNLIFAGLTQNLGRL